MSNYHPFLHNRYLAYLKCFKVTAPTLHPLVWQHLCVCVCFCVKTSTSSSFFSLIVSPTAHLKCLYWNHKLYYLDVFWLFNRTCLRYLWDLLSGEAGFSRSRQPQCVYPSQNVSSTQFCLHPSRNCSPFTHKFFHTYVSPSADCFMSVFIHQTLRVPGPVTAQTGSLETIVRWGREREGGRRVKSSFKMLIRGHF